jgi:putative ABC transport system substrate-binding protein
MAYEPSIPVSFRRTVANVDKIFRGTTPRFANRGSNDEFAIKLKKAKVLGLSIPPALLATADEAIRIFPPVVDHNKLLVPVLLRREPVM